MRVLGVDPGLTRCGLAVVDRVAGGKLKMIDVGVILTDKGLELEDRLLELDRELANWIERFQPDVVAVERVFSQLNVRTAMATGQAAGVALLLAAKSKIPVAMHTPSEVKAAVTGSGRADKAQVGEMVRRLLGLPEVPEPADAADALALAICHIYQSPIAAKVKANAERAVKR